MDNLVKKGKYIKKDKQKAIAGIKLPPIEHVKEINLKTVTDIDPSFYTLIRGRPVRQNKSIQEYKRSIKNVALTRTIHSFLNDEILRIDREVESERNIYETAFKHFEEYQNSFDKFLAHDNNKTIAIMQRSDALAKELIIQNEDHKKANYEMASLKSKLQYINETLMILLSFQNFLNKASPILWQESHNIKLDVKYADVFTNEPNIFNEIDRESVKLRLMELPPAQLYFETPEQLITIFGLLEKQNLNYLLVTEEFNSEKNRFMKTLDVLKKLMHQELEYIEEKIKEKDNIIVLNENKEVELKEIFFRILEDKIRYLFSSETALQIFNYVEFAYEHVIAPNEIDCSSLDMAHALEREYDNLMLEISAYDLNVIKQIEKETYSSGTKQLKQAKVASKLLKDVDKLSKRLTSCYEPNRANFAE